MIITDNNICRRDFLKACLAASCAMITVPGTFAGKKKIRFPDISKWKGFNLLNKFNPDFQKPFEEKDFEIMATWGFNFARLPLSYWCWSSENDWYHIDEKVLSEIDRAVEFGKQYGIHVNINFHRVPGYCINPPKEAKNLFEDEDALLACEYHWKTFAERYQSYPAECLSFNLINEAPYIEDAKYEKVVRRLIATIHKASPERIIIVDGLDVGTRPLMSLIDSKEKIIQSGRGYQPMLISHYGANWVYGDGPMYFPKENLSWPLYENGKIYDKSWIRESLDKNWQPWVNQGGKIHIGEFGCHNRTPHDIALAWLGDQLDIFSTNNWGWSLWNLYGSFGVLDSGRSDVKYENFRGHKLDRRMLELLKEHI